MIYILITNLLKKDYQDFILVLLRKWHYIFLIYLLATTI